MTNDACGPPLSITTIVDTSSHPSDLARTTMKRAASPPPAPKSLQKRARVHTPPRSSLTSWLKPGEPAPLLVSSPHLHAVSSTFTSFALSLNPPSTVRNADALKKHVQNVVRGLDIVSLVGKELLETRDGAFQSDGGMAPGPRKRAREPDHRMWACRTLALKDGRDGTQGEDDYQVSAPPTAAGGR